MTAPFRPALLSLLLAGLVPVASAEIVIEERPLSRPFTPSAPAAPPVVITASPEPAPPTPVSNTPQAAPETTEAGSTVAGLDLFTKVQLLQKETAELRGLIEQQAHLIERLQADLRSRYTDLDQRLLQQQAQQKPDPAAAEPAATTTPATATATPANTGSEDEKRAYLAAYDMFRSGGPDKAIPPMLAFVNRYPASAFTPGAHYWLGEFYLNAGTPNPASARKHFETVLAKFPEHDKAPASLYKLASIHDLQGRPQEARALMQELLKSYPQSPEAALADTWLKATAPAAKPAPAKPASATPAKPSANTAPAPAKKG